MSNAKLQGANFALCRFADADLTNADLSGANLSHANFQFAKMQGVNLDGANICYAIGDGKVIKNLHPATPENWWISYTYKEMSIGCEQHPLDDWWQFGDEIIRVMAPLAKKLWEVNKVPIKNAIAAFPAEEYG